MDFQTAWERIALGVEVAVTTGAPEPADIDSQEYRSWKTGNFTGTLTAKVEDPARGFQIALPADESGQVTLTVYEMRSHDFALVAPLLGDLKIAKWDEVKARRDRAEHRGCNTPMGRVDTDEVSKGRINGAVVMANIALGQGQPFIMTWTMADNSAVDHDANQMIAMGVAVGEHVDECHAIARTLRDTIEAATTIAELEAIDIEAASWPA